MSNKIKIFGELESGVNGGYVVDKDAVKGLSDIAKSITDGDVFSADLNSTTSKIEFKNAAGTKLFEIDAKPFIKDGMLKSVTISNGNLVFTFNEDGIDPVSIPLADIFNPDNYYNKTEIDEMAGDIKTKESITVAGGPLADDTSDNWPADWKDDAGNKVIPAGLTLEDVLTNLFLKEVDGTVSKGSISWNPTMGKPTATLSSNGPVEVGTEITATVAVNNTVSSNTRSCTVTASQGHFTSLDGSWVSGNKVISKAGTTSGTNVLTCQWNGTATNITSNSTKLKVVSGTNTLSVSQSGLKASVDALPTTTVYASTNTKKILSDVSVTVTDTKPADKTLTATSSSDTITGYYRWMAYASASDAFSKTETSWKFTNANSVASVTVPDGQYLVIAVPSGFTLKTATQMGLDFKGSLTSETVNNVTIGGTSTHTYTKYYWKNTSGSAATIDNITIG